MRPDLTRSIGFSSGASTPELHGRGVALRARYFMPHPAGAGARWGATVQGHPVVVRTEV